MKRYGFGIDVGGTAIKMGLFTTDGELIEKWEIKTNKEDQGSRIFDDIAEQIDEKISERNISKSEVAGIGIGVPGPVKADGTVVKCVNVGWGILNVEQELAMRTGLTVKAGNVERRWKRLSESAFGYPRNRSRWRNYHRRKYALWLQWCRW